jgi:hypothetical protein
MSAPVPPRSPGGIYTGGCLVLVLAVLLVIGALLWGAISTYQGIYQMTSPLPRDLSIVPPATPEISQRLLQAKLVLESTEGGEIRLRPEDLNYLCFGEGRNPDLVQHMRFETEGDWLVAQMSVPLGFMAQIPFLPSVRDRFFNGRIAARVSKTGDHLKIESFDLESNGKRLPWLFTGQSYRESIAQGLESALKNRLPNAEQILQRTDSIRVENGDLVVHLKAK